MTKQQFLETYPTPNYIGETWKKVSEKPSLDNLQAWSEAWNRLRAEREQMWNNLYGGGQ